MIGGDGERLIALVAQRSGRRVGVGFAGVKRWGHAKLAFKNAAGRLRTLTQ